MILVAKPLFVSLTDLPEHLDRGTVGRVSRGRIDRVPLENLQVDRGSAAHPQLQLVPGQKGQSLTVGIEQGGIK